MHNNPTNVMYFSRRRSRARSGQRSGSLPDWVWGAGLGAIVVLFVGAYFLIAAITGTGTAGACDGPLPPLGTSTVNAEEFIRVDAALGQVISLLDQGDRQTAEASFFGPTHNFTHNVDPHVREQDEDLAKNLCRAVIALEDNLATRAPAPQLSADVQRVRELLRDAAAVLGYPRPG
jgi:hypothetical protein